MGTSNIKPTFDGEPDTAKGATDLTGAVMTGEPPEEQTSPRDKEVKIWLPLIKDIFKLPELKPKLEQFFIKDKIKKGTQVTLNKDELEKFLDRKNKDYRPSVELVNVTKKAHNAILAVIDMYFDYK